MYTDLSTFTQNSGAILGKNYMGKPVNNKGRDLPEHPFFLKLESLILHAKLQDHRTSDTGEDF